MPARYIGAHMPTSKGIGNAIREGKRIGCTAIQVFTSSPRMWKASPPTEEKIDDFKAAVKETGIEQLVSHDTYLVNLCHQDEEVAEKSLATLRDEMERCGAYGIPFVVSHMGALVGQELEDGLKKIARRTLEILKSTPESVTLLMETTAGQGSSVNSRFEEVATLLELTKHPSRFAVCMDTCHIFAAGYDIRTPETYHTTMEEFDKLVGLERLKVIHVNDSKKGLGSRVDRHDNLGKGMIGAKPFGFFVNDTRLENAYMVVETPIENEGHEKDIECLRSLIA